MGAGGIRIGMGIGAGGIGIGIGAGGSSAWAQVQQRQEQLRAWRQLDGWPTARVAAVRVSIVSVDG